MQLEQNLFLHATAACTQCQMVTCNTAGMIGGQPQLQPTFNVHVEVGRGAATWSGDGIKFQQEVPVTRRVAFEVNCRQVCFLF